MSWFWAVGIALLVSGVVAAFVVGSRPYVHKNVTAERFSRLLDTLYDTMTDGSILVIRHDCSEAFLQFVKRASPVGDVLGFGFPDADWSRTHWSPLLRCLQENSVEYSVAETGDGAVPRFVEVECAEAPVAEALSVAKLALRVLAIPDDATFTATLEGELDRSC